MLTLNKFFLKLFKPVNKIALEDQDASFLMFFNEISPEIHNHEKYKATIDKKNVFILTLETLMNINIPLKRSNLSSDVLL
ncbi:hypothetical protein PORY_001880 [Pneumocystis oryctolagi]|uniref:Uncharacterized protein n=1 Tax=Pneumocystis oryctolagi TaxID=42067 RepID=A0ACB7CEB1_9ASCO|nr:hypothetical protein PORY_001880 [Pneumocystis oryctolagi]